MENFLASVLESMAVELDEDPRIDVACEIASAFGAVLDEDECALWVGEVVPRVWDLLERELLEGQLNLFEDWGAIVAGMPARLLSVLPVDVRRRIDLKWPPSWKRAALVANLDDLTGVKYIPERFHPLEIPGAAAKVVSVSSRVSVEEAVGLTPAPALSGFALLQALPAWAMLLPAARAVFTVMYRRASRSKSAAHPWCQVSVGLLVKATGYRRRQVERALAQLRRGRWVGYIVRGRPQIGASRYWIATSPAHLGVRLTASVLAELGFKT